MQLRILRPKRLRVKPVRLLNALYRTARKQGLPITIGPEYRLAEFLLLYGWGGEPQRRAIAQHPGRYALFDLGYWDRDGMQHRKWRVSFDAFHPQKYVMRVPSMGDHRFDSRGLSVYQKERTFDPQVILIPGMGIKSQRNVPKNWAAKAAIEARATFPRAKIWYKPKVERYSERGVDYDKIVSGDIGDVLRGVSLVYCRHSNVAVDACRAGVPVVCKDGAAAAIYPSQLREAERQPRADERLDFLRRLAWWQWSIDEIEKGKFYPWLFEALKA